MAKTRKVLERVPEDKLDWRAHPKSNTIGWNANHLTEIPSWVVPVLTTPSLDIAPAGGAPSQSPKLRSRQELLALFDRNVAAARKAIESVRDDQLAQPWSLLKGGSPLFTMPRAAVVRIAGRAVPRVRTYGDAEPGTPVALIGSSGRLEVAVVQGSAAVHLLAGVGTAVEVVPAGPP